MQAHINNLNADLVTKTIDMTFFIIALIFSIEYSTYTKTGETLKSWMGRCLKLDFIFKTKADWSSTRRSWSLGMDMVEDIEFPDSQSTSVFLSLSSSIRNRYLPSFDDAGINFQSGEDSIINEPSREAEEF